MKKILIFIIIILAFVYIRVDAKELVTESVTSIRDFFFMNDISMIPSNNDSVIVVDSSSTYDGSFQVNGGTLQFTEYSYDGKMINNTFYNDGRKYYNIIQAILDNEDYVLIGVGDSYFQDSEYNNCYIVKIDKNGNTIWERFEKLDEYSEFYSIIKSRDGSYIVLGENYNDSGFIIKYSSNGDKLWLYSLDDDLTNSNLESVVELNNGHYLVSGFYYDSTIDQYKSFILEIDENGTLLNIYNLDNKYSFLRNMIYYADYIYAICGNHSDNPDMPLYIVKMSLDGNIIDEYEFFSTNYEHFSLSTNGDILLAYDYNSGVDFYDVITRFDNFLNVKWSKEFKNIDQPHCYIGQIYEKENGKLLLLKHTNNSGSFSFFDQNGNMLFTKKLENNIFGMSYYDAFISKNGNYIFSGLVISSESNNLLSYFSKDGNLLWKSNSFIVNYNDYYSDVIETFDHRFVAIGRRGDFILDVVDENGSIVESRNYGVLDYTYNSSENINRHILELSDHNYLFLYDYDSIMKLDSDFNELWRNDYNVSFFDASTSDYCDSSIVELSDNSYLYIQNGCANYYSTITKLDPNGNVLNQKVIEFDIPQKYSLAFETNENDIVIVGSVVNDLDEKGKGFFLKYNSNLELVSSKDYEFSNSEPTHWQSWPISDYSFNSITKMDDGSFAITGYVLKREDGWSYIGLLVIINDDLNLVYEKEIGAKEYFDTFTNDIDFVSANILDDSTLRVIGVPPIRGGNGTLHNVFDIYYKYDIIPKKSKNGTISIDKKSARNKEAITITAKPNLGYIVDKIILTDTKGNKTEFRDLTFEMIPDDVEVEVVFKQLINPQTGFSLISIITMLGCLIFITIKSKKKTLTN